MFDRIFGKIKIAAPKLATLKKEDNIWYNFTENKEE
jgi:hypothetical protein